ncbi:MAG: type IV toxin-antitoxin system AbiEi family antitoxin domain-containing protein [Dehalococcoidales bacterium]|nr:type IV toxin-antitoxin system AbiEi family antitoxin domain-containing protein [Dehalococcoidales bacterium]
MANDRIEYIVDIVKTTGVFRARDLDQKRIPRAYLQRLLQEGLIDRIGRGLYSVRGANITEHHTIVEASTRVPQGIICLLSALRFHNLTTQSPSKIWMAINRKARLPKVDYPSLKFVRFSGYSLTEGIEEHQIEGVQVRIYNPAKTVVDCFKYRNKIGLDVAMEALRDCLRQRKCTVDEILSYAKICRVTQVIKPYVEAMV